MITATCLYCERTFHKNRKDKKYCSRSCKTLAKDKRTNRRQLHRKFLKDSCENCGFIPIHKCQLDVDHVDGNHKNNEPRNLRTLCANCHRLKTFINQDWQK